jgi:uncharacterized glyoxalase superfamily protein PhnB
MSLRPCLPKLALLPLMTAVRTLTSESAFLTVNALDEAERIFLALAEKGKIQMPRQKTFWSGGFGVVVDQCDIAWEINCEQAPGISE